MTYTELVGKVAAWIHRDDLTSVMPDFVALVEERINRDLRVRQMEIALSATPITSSIITPDSTVVDAKVLWADEGCPLKAQALESVVSSGAYGTPTMYAWSGGNFYFDGGGDVQGVLYQRIPSLQTYGPNWASEQSPSLYLFGVLAEACMYVQDNDAAQLWGARFQQVVSDLNGNDNRRSGPLVARAS